MTWKAGLFFPLLLLGGCAGLKSSQPAPAIYVVHAAGCPAASLPAGPVLSIAEPAVPSGFDTQRIALYLDGGRRLDYFAAAAWPDHLEKMLQQLILQTPCDIIAAPPDTAGSAAATLYVKVNDFEPMYAAGPDAAPGLKVSMTFRLVSKEPERTLLDFTLQQAGDAPANTLTGVTGGLETLSRTLLAEAFREIGPKLAQLRKKPHPPASRPPETVSGL